MKKNIFLLSVAVFTLFISACGAADEDGIFAGSECTFEGSEICSDNGIEILVCQSSTWNIKKECNISIGKKCKQGPDGALGCFGDGEHGSSGNSDNGETETPDVSDSDSIPDNGETDSEDTETEGPDTDDTTEDPTDDSDSEPQTDPEPTEPENTETPDNDSDTTPDNDTDSDNDTDTDTDNQTPPAGQCTSNSDCSGSTPYCSISTSQCIANAVFITEYVKGSSLNKAIEIYNGSKSPVNLNNFTIQQANNGKNWGTTNYIYSFPDSVQLNSGATYVVCNSGAGSELSGKCNNTASSGSTFDFNGDDGMALFEGSSIVDQIGNTDYKYWSVAGIENATLDHTLRRKTTVIHGTTDWNTSAGTTAENSQWEVLAKDTYDGLGSR